MNMMDLVSVTLTGNDGRKQTWNLTGENNTESSCQISFKRDKYRGISKCELDLHIEITNEGRMSGRDAGSFVTTFIPTSPPECNLTSLVEPEDIWYPMESAPRNGVPVVLKNIQEDGPYVYRFGNTEWVSDVWVRAEAIGGVRWAWGPDNDYFYTGWRPLTPEEMQRFDPNAVDSYTYPRSKS